MGYFHVSYRIVRIFVIDIEGPEQPVRKQTYSVTTEQMTSALLFIISE